MSEPKDFVAAMDSNSRKTPVRVAFVTRRTSPHVKAHDDDTVMTFPEGLFRAAVAVEVLALILVAIALLWDAPLEGLADPTVTPNPAKAPWYFLGLQEMVSYSAFWGGVGVPGIFVVLLLLVPYIDRGAAGVGKWFARERLLANTIFLTLVLVNVMFIIIGTFFRGPNWSMVLPW